MAISYSGFRQGQHPDRGAGANNPSRAEVLEDLQILAAHGFDLIRLYDSGENSQTVLEVIAEHDLAIDVLLGIWLSAEASNHERCPWLVDPIPAEQLAENRARNEREVRRCIELAGEFEDVVVAINVGNEMLVDWTDHLVPLPRVLDYVQTVRDAVAAPVTVAENYDWWRKNGQQLAAALDFVGVHTYPIWEGRSIGDAMAYTIENVESVRAALPGTPLAILEAGWATTASEFGDRAGQQQQLRYLEELSEWAAKTGTTVFWFEAFDEPWKGDPANPMGAEKHWGLFTVDREPKEAARKALSQIR